MTHGKLDLATLEAKDAFVHRHIGPSEADIADMLDSLGLGSLDALTDQAVPDAIRGKFPDGLAGARTEQDVLAELLVLAQRNVVAKSMIGMGYYDTYTPPVILRNLLENPGWYTAYTPYQPEISQGRLEALLIFQTMVMDLTGMDCANASLLDEATAAAEAVNMSRAVAKGSGQGYFVSEDCHPQTIAVLQTRARSASIEITIGDHRKGLEDGAFFGALLQYPASGGAINDYRAFIDEAHEKGMLVTVAADLLSLVCLVPPSEFGADIVVGSAQRFGVPMGFGGPHAAFYATHEKYRRSLPGRIVGLSVDKSGQPALRLALQTREQHIRREKATSNICTAQVLLAVMAAMYAVYHGPTGLGIIAARVHRLTSILASGLSRLGISVANKSWFDTLTLDLPGKAEAVLARAAEAGLNLRRIDGDRLGISLDETTLPEDVNVLFEMWWDWSPRWLVACRKIFAAKPKFSPMPNSTPIIRKRRCCVICIASKARTSHSIIP